MQGEPFVETIPPRPARSIFDETGKIVAGGLGHLPDNHDIDADLFGNGCPLPVSGPGGQSLAHGQRYTETIATRSSRLGRYGAPVSGNSRQFGVRFHTCDRPWVQ